MVTYSTQNPLGSADPRDLYDNAQVIDDYANSENATTTDRLGNERATIAGIDADARAAIANAGYEFVGDYAAGIEMAAYNQVVRDTSGEFWRVSGSTALPYTTTGAGLPEGGAFVSVGDAALRQELAAENGALLVRGSVIYVDTIADLQALDTSGLVDGQAIRVTSTGRGGSFVVQLGDFSSEVTRDPESGIWVPFDDNPDGSTVVAMRDVGEGAILASWFGLVDDISISQETPIQAALDYSWTNGSYKKEVVIPSHYNVKFTVINVPSGVTLWAVGCQLESTQKPGLTVNPRSKVYGFGTRFIDGTDSIPAQIQCLDKTVVNNEVEIVGFEMFAVGGAKTGRAVELTGLYQSKVDVSVSGYDQQYYRDGDVACYYNEITVSATNTNVGALVRGTLFNGNEIIVKRCNVDDYGIRLYSAGGNKLDVRWIEKVTTYGIRLIGCSGTTIISGVIEGEAGAISAIDLAEGTSGTTIIGTRFGKEFAASNRRVTAAGSTLNTTILTDEEVYLNHDGVIASVGGGTGNRVNVGSIRGTEPVVGPKSTVADLPSASVYNGGYITVTDEVGGQVLAFSDGVNWRRSTDRAIVS